MSEPADSQMQITANMTGLINFGVFKLKILLINRALEATAEANSANSGQDGLITTTLSSLTRWCAWINYGLWSSQEVYAKMNANPPMAEPLLQMKSFANNEFQMSPTR